MKLKAYAKLNLTLDVTGKRADGYHLLDSVMQSVSLCDTVQITRSDRLTVHCSQTWLNDDGNIAAAAARRFFEAAGLTGGADIYIEKNIPVAAGLGGGSADAAAVLCGLNRLYDAGLSDETLQKIALTVGADVPFCMTGGTAHVDGIGERLEPLPPIKGLYFVIAKSAAKASTADMYRQLDQNGLRAQDNTKRAVDAINRGDIHGLTEAVGNAFAVLTGLYGVDRMLASLRPAAVSLSGSGPAVFAVFGDRQTAREAYGQLRHECECHLAVPVDCGVTFE